MNRILRTDIKTPGRSKKKTARGGNPPEGRDEHRIDTEKTVGRRRTGSK